MTTTEDRPTCPVAHAGPGIGAESVVAFPGRVPGRPFPPPEYADLRAAGPIRSRLPSGDTAWLVTRYEHVRTVLTDSRISSNGKHPGFPSPLGTTGGVPTLPGWFVALDPPEHDRFRKTLIPEFSVRKVRSLRPAIQEVVDGLIDRLLAKDDHRADLVSEFSLPVPSLVISALLGVPKADRDFFEGRTQILVDITSSDEERTAATTQLQRYIARLIRVKKTRPGDDLVTRLIAAGTITDAELVGVLTLLLIAGHETTANNISLGTLTLLQNPEWVGGDDGVIGKNVVDEVLRYHSVADLVALRVAVADIEIGGTLIRAGEGIVPLIAAANHDDEAFGCPARFDPDRSARHHVAFGYGVHQCLGQNLVRIEMDVAYETLFRRIPSLRLDAPVEELPFKHDAVLFGLHSMPVAW